MTRPLADSPPCDHPYEGWFVDGVPLDKHGFLISQFTETTPPRRGEDYVIARQPGTLFAPKVYGPRRQALTLWARKEDEFGQVLNGHERNLDRLKTLFGGGLRQVELTRRLSLPFERVSTRRADVELVDALAGSRTALTSTGVYISFGVDLLFQNPFWYEPPNVLTGQGDEFVVWNPGTVQHHNAIVRIHGPSVDPVITVTSTGSVVRYVGTIEAGDSVEIDSFSFTAVDQNGDSVAGNLDREQVFFVEVAPGRNLVTLTDNATPYSTATVDFSWEPAFL